MRIKNETTNKVKFFDRRDKFIKFLLQQNPNVNEHDLRLMRSEDLVEKYLKGWRVMARGE